MRGDEGKAVIGLIFIVLVLALSIWKPINKISNLREETIVVTDKMVKNDTYLIYTKDATYEITDSWLYGRFDSSDLYGKIEVGKTYKVTVGGQRVHFLSVYPCIHEVEEAYASSTFFVFFDLGSLSGFKITFGESLCRAIVFFFFQKIFFP